MSKTAVGAPAPSPSIDEMLEAVEKWTFLELKLFEAKLQALIEKIALEKVEEKNQKY